MLRWVTIKRVRGACSDNGNEVSFRFTDAFWITIHYISANEIAKKAGISHRKTQEDIAKLIKKESLNVLVLLKAAIGKLSTNNMVNVI